MQASKTFKRAFLHLMLKGLNEAHSKTSMSFLERKNAIKLSADSALAIARGRTAWSRALIMDLSVRDPTNNASKKILRKSLRRCCKRNVGASSTVVARMMMKKRTRLLKKLIPGGESLNSLSLLADNAVDYAIHLQAQVNIMQCIARALGASTAFKWELWSARKWFKQLWLKAELKQNLEYSSIKESNIEMPVLSEPSIIIGNGQEFSQIGVCNDNDIF